MRYVQGNIAKGCAGNEKPLQAIDHHRRIYRIVLVQRLKVQFDHTSLVQITFNVFVTEIITTITQYCKKKYFTKKITSMQKCLRLIVAYLPSRFVHMLGQKINETWTGTSRRSNELSRRTNHQWTRLSAGNIFVIVWCSWHFSSIIIYDSMTISKSPKWLGHDFGNLLYVW